MRRILASTVVALPLIFWAMSPKPAMVAQQAAADAHPEMPAGAGKEVALKACTKCHAITNITSQHKDADGWTETITKMVGYGATGSDEEFQTILDYLTTNFGVKPAGAATAASPAADAASPTKIDVNKGTAKELATQIGLTDDEAKAVVTYRDKNGSFKSIDDLKKVPNVDAKKIDAKKDYLNFS